MFMDFLLESKYVLGHFDQLSPMQYNIYYCIFVYTIHTTPWWNLYTAAPARLWDVNYGIRYITVWVDNTIYY